MKTETEKKTQEKNKHNTRSGYNLFHTGYDTHLDITRI
ncbi:predicted protein [Plenodomus lingam JN3]|uniref:Predicted protein n=1 Tax=Leptosphaeria maculans (strain JN3 / isolate v23.1.3 / race Av1-4-5-6-7-8) TaxID=985895 RepID=E4ZVM3_LEPMJ|nr:predicted protein [Plenodomus lingam JN3]CBX95649.1 predicted protein [Plenodomus lingam JN3]